MTTDPIAITTARTALEAAEKTLTAIMPKGGNLHDDIAVPLSGLFGLRNVVASALATIKGLEA